MNDTKDIIGEMKEAIGEKIVSLAKSKEHLLAKKKKRGCLLFFSLIGKL